MIRSGSSTCESIPLFAKQVHFESGDLETRSPG